jgi:bifunctional non-homologous end joining protein LigD
MWRDDPANLRPMLATTAAAPLESADLAYEPKYDGIRATALVDVGRVPRRGPASVRLWSRLGNEKTTQFPEVADALREFARRIGRPVVLDGEIVALDERGAPIGFQNLQGRIHLKAPRKGAPYGDVRPSAEVGRAFTARHEIAYIVFDLLREGDEDLRPLPLRERRARLERLFHGYRHPRLRITEQVVGDATGLYARAQAEGWEGLIAKRLDSLYRSGKRSPDWRKLKLVRRQACVIGGWTEPRGSRPFFGALLLGIYDERDRLIYVGHSGAGFTDAELGRVWKELRALETKICPFAAIPRTNERPHWVKPRLVAEVKFTEWTADGKLRHPTYLGLRDDIKPESVRNEPDIVVRAGRPEGRPRRSNRRNVVGADLQVRPAVADRARAPSLTKSAIAHVLEQIEVIEDQGGSGTLDLPGGNRLVVSNLNKIFWPTLKLTKGNLFRHYLGVAPYLLPVLADRPLVMKRYPNGVNAKPFYQHRAPDKLPAGVRVEQVTSETETRPHVIGGSLTTLLYTAQLAAISQDPWFSRVQSQDMMDHAAIDLDPPEGLPFSRVLDVARWVHEELDILKAPGFAKTSGSGGLHIYIPMPPDTSYDAGLLFCQIVSTMVSKKHPKAATIERSLKARGSRIYLDYMQNGRGKTLASAYSARANDFAGVSVPITWTEVDEGISPRDFTMRTVAQRLEQVGDLWAPLRKSRGADLRAVMAYVEG